MAGNKGEHRYEVVVDWTGNEGVGTSDYRSYKRDHLIRAAGKPDIPGSSDPAFRGDSSRWNPEDLLVASLSACHKLWYLHMCAAAGVTVVKYRDRAVGTMVEDGAGGGRFTRVVLRPEVSVQSGGDTDLAQRLHHEAHARCFVANSVNFPVEIESAVDEAREPS